jgi:ubiquinone/menaquinone biosynthesis C-methylase UbiE
VIDLGCGTGLTLAGLRRGVGADGEVVGADLTPAMLEVARRRGPGTWTNMRLMEGDAAHLTFGDSSFDKILVAFSLYIIPDHEAAISEIQRVLRPGGRFVDLETGPPERGPWRGWNGRHPGLAHVCRVDSPTTCPAPLGRVFPYVELRRRMAGWFVLAVCDK